MPLPTLDSAGTLGDNMKKLSAVLGLLLLTAATMAAQGRAVQAKQTSGGAAQATGKMVARVNGVALTDRDLLRQMMIQFPYAKQHGGKFPPAMEKDIRRAALSNIEFEELAYQEAQRRKLTVPQAKLDAALRDFKKQFATTADFTNYLYAEQQGSLDILKANIKRAILIDMVLKSEVRSKSSLTQAELLDHYKKNPALYTMPESAAFQTISILIPDNATPQQKNEARRKAEGILKQAQATKDYEGFGALAEKVSDDDWRVMMGDHKTVHKGRMPPAIEAVVFKMKPNTVSGLIAMENSFCIVRVNAITKAQVLPFAKVRPTMKKELEASKSAQLRDALEARLRQGAKVEEF